MRFVRPALMLVTIAALAAYGFDRPVTSTPDEAMQCCDSMPCSSQGHQRSEDCCKTMLSFHAPFVQAASAHGVQISLVPLAVLPVASNPAGPDVSASAILAADSHAPPNSQPPLISPLRI